MKQFSVSNQLTLVGKAWEIRSRLRSLIAEGRTLEEYLGKHQPASTP
ncbi:Z-ring formation inhibitor MciZ [Paenibacillus xanthanilyticus]|uniref:Z-ring formation inhibitor MciZ n=1 Tax=Paenibacillus xanthanilyticus TaxID=1783531 RepID=A0ABV8KCM2_9BACL